MPVWVLKHWYKCWACGWQDRQTNHKAPPERCPECLTTATGITGLNGELSYAAAIAGSSVGPTIETGLVAALSTWGRDNQQAFSRMSADEKKISSMLRKLNKMIAKEWRQIEPELKRCIKAGDYDAEKYLRSRVLQRQRELIREWQDWRLTQPPFMTNMGGYYVQHQVTPENSHENSHLLNPSSP